MSFYYLQQNERGTFDLVVMPAIRPAPILPIDARWHGVSVRRYSCWRYDAELKVPGAVRPLLRNWD